MVASRFIMRLSGHEAAVSGSWEYPFAADPNGNINIAGDFSGTATFGTNVLVSVGSQEMFVAKYDGQGQALWARRIGAYDPNGGSSLGFTVDDAGNIFLLSSYSGTAGFGTTNVSGTAAFLAKYDAGGNLLWAKGISPGGATAICIGGSGAIYTCGLILAKYDNAGNQIWARPFAPAQSMVLDSSENIYATGMGNGTYGDLTVTNVGGISDFFAAKCDSNGNLVWSRQMGSTKQQIGMSIALDLFGNVYVGSTSASATRDPLITFGNTILTNVMSLILKYDATGNPLWARALGGTNRAQPVAVRVLNPGSVFVAGTFYCSAQFGSFTLADGNPACSGDIYVTRLAGMEPPALPQITRQPQDQIVRAATTAALGVTVAPSGIPLSYQWYSNGTSPVAGEVNPSLVFSNVQISASGNYLVTVANAYGSVTSSMATLTVYLTEAATLNSTTVGGSNQIQFAIGGVAGFKYAIEASTNLTDWMTLSTNAASSFFVDPQAGNFQQRFYRTIWLP